MLSQIGTILEALGLVAALYATVAVYRSIRQEDQRWWESGRNGVVAAAALLGAAVILLFVAFLDDQFSIDYVARHSSRALPLYLKATAVWGGQDGSLLLWAFLQALFAVLLLARPSDEAQPLIRWATVLMGMITSFFAGVTVLLSDPFELASVALADGQGLNPLLRHPGMVFHPPAMYLGYVGLAVPFALALAALITRRVEKWSAAARSWTLAAWLFLGLGLLLGMRWAYDVLGWGGYWGWDPVENAGLMPWLTATALLHALIMGDQRRGFRWWSMILTMLSFLLVLFGTFTTRSGLIQSVHAFARSPLGPYFLAAMGLTIAGSLAVFYSRRRLLSTSSSSDDLLSREGLFTLTMVLFLTITGSVLVGSLLPTLTEALTDARFEAGPSWFDRVTGPQFAALVLVMGICPLIARLGAASRSLGRAGLASLVGAVGLAALGFFAGFTGPASLMGLAIVGLAGGTALAEMGRGVIRRTRTGEGPIQALWDLFGRNRRRYGGYLVHLGIVLMAVGVIGTRFYPFETEVVLSPGEAVDVREYSLVVGDLGRDMAADHSETYVPLDVYRNQRYLGSLQPRLDEYIAYHQTVSVPAVMSGLRQDLYIVLAGWSEGGAQLTLKVLINPLASFLWLGGLVLMAGGALAVWPEPRGARIAVPHARRRRVVSAAGVVIALVLLALAAWSMWGGALTTAASIAPLSERASAVPPSSVADDASAGSDAAAQGSGGSSTNPTAGRPRVGEPAPNLDIELLDGSAFSLHELEDRVAVINFWSPDCRPCRDELPDLQWVWEGYRERGVAFIGISLPNLADDVEAMMAEFDVTYPVALDPMAPMHYGVTGVPETFVIDSDGKVAYVHVGPVTAEQLRRELDALLLE